MNKEFATIKIPKEDIELVCSNCRENVIDEYPKKNFKANDKIYCSRVLFHPNGSNTVQTTELNVHTKKPLKESDLYYLEKIIEANKKAVVIRHVNHLQEIYF